MAGAALINTLSTMIQEELPTIMHESLPRTDPIYLDVVRTSQDVNQKDIGRGWKVMHRFRTSLSGQYEPRNIGANLARDVATSGPVNQVMLYGTLASFPKPSETPHVGSVVRTISLNCHRGNFGLPTHILKAAALSDIAAKDIADDLKGLAEKRAHMEAISFYMNSTGYLGTIDYDDDTLSSAAVTSGGSPIGPAQYYSLLFTPGSSRIRWWKPGMLLDAFTSATMTARLNEDASDNTVVQPLLVDSVDYIAGTVRLVALNGGVVDDASHGVISGATAKNLENSIYPTSGSYYVFPLSADNVDGGSGTVYRVGHFGLESWMKSSGQLMDATMQGRLDSSAATWSLTTYPQFKSKVVSDLAGPLTEDVLNNLLGGFIDAYGQNTLDTLITTNKVLLKHLQQAQLGPNRFVYERDTRPLSITGGWDKVTYTYEGRTYKVRVSPYCQSGKLYVLKTGENNLKRYIPPRSAAIGGLKSGGTGMNMGNEIEFLNPIVSGDGNIFSITRDSDGRTEPQVEAPFEQHSQIAPIDVRGINVAGITEVTSL